ncbi:hypothetical protein CKM354_000312300 [Cercospora kikuchii]|uniref:protein-tyrosine-phosphatase n=1 Tax=Cercospora kikuchii TaxID=84275 RepID=A0A9P3F9Z3_9PEZI|nr:uncharacterized protein CKM354_000312300 [Cercospora kikuchii]GIZ39751.1 hypothetical protein CKM354_000312300 [Cercospora kikuchii]
MSHADEQTKQLPHPVSSDTHSIYQHSHDYDGFIRKFHNHNLSDSTNMTGSNESSPTTTISTVDDSSATEPSPGSSPESPPPTTFTVGMLRPRTADERSAPFFELQKQPPPRKGRNLKNLAVVTSRHPARAASTTSLPLQAQPEAAILSPSFVKPPTPPRRKPSNLGLTLLTPGGSKPAPVPATPGFARPGTLRHFQSSPSLPLVPGLSLPHGNGAEFRKQRTLETILSPVEIVTESPPIPEREDEDEEQNFDVPLSREEKPEAYPDGPICVYDPHIDLYLEPTAEQARQYDVVMNVASEVRNPLVNNEDLTCSEPDLRIDGGGGIQFKPRKDRDHLVVRKTDSQESQDPDTSPTTPKASPSNASFAESGSARQEPEYIHVKWEHNSDIVPDLLRLCKLIDDRVTEGKRVLIHCQCGVSRSASLVVAYGLYKNPSMSVQEAYDAVKRRSKWIGPNMNLIMQLQEFRSSLARGGLLTARSTLSPLTPGSALSEWSGPFSSRSPELLDEPRSAVDRSPTRGAGGADEAVSPGPSSAPSGFPWPLSDKPAASNGGQLNTTAAHTGPFVDPSGHVVPVIALSNPAAVETVPGQRFSRQTTLPAPAPVLALLPPVTSPRSTEFAMAPIRPSEQVDPGDDFGIMSPTSTEFAANPFDRSALLASLGMGTMRADEETPRRSLSLRNRDNRHLPPPAKPERTLRGKISSPSLREQQRLRELQAQIEANLHIRENSPTGVAQEDSDALMSPRATSFTENPFALALETPAASAAHTNPPRLTVQDPRSPSQKGASPITRNILDVL